MQLSDFNFELPQDLIAHYPVKRRSQSRLLCLDATNGEIQHKIFSDFIDLLQADDLLVFNDTRVIPARLFGIKQSGGKVEVLIERIMDDNRVLAQVRASKALKPGGSIVFSDDQLSATTTTTTASVEGREDEFYILQFPTTTNLYQLLDRIGHIPLPPYIKRSDQPIDSERYQTVYARNAGAVAAPTAGLHFDEAMLQAVSEKGIDTAYLTLHVGAGTFQPVRVDNVLEHRMHSERIEVSAAVCEKVSGCKAAGGRVIAVGTTTVRSLESAAVAGQLKPFYGETDIFIYPGYQFQIVDAMITNFHLPESTLLMLVSAFATKEMLLDAYRQAIDHQYRFFSYGDAMFIHRSDKNGAT